MNVDEGKFIVSPSNPGGLTRREACALSDNATNLCTLLGDARWVTRLLELLSDRPGTLLHVLSIGENVRSSRAREIDEFRRTIEVLSVELEDGRSKIVALERRLKLLDVQSKIEEEDPFDLLMDELRSAKKEIADLRRMESVKLARRSSTPKATSSKDRTESFM